MHCVNLAEAKAGLSGLLDAAEAGEEVVVITRRGRSVARLIRDSDGEAAFSDWVARLRRFHAHQPGPWDPQWSCCGSCAIRSLESGKDLPHALPNLVRPAGAISTGESPRPAPSRHQQRYGESTPHPSDSNGLTPGPSPTGLKLKRPKACVDRTQPYRGGIPLFEIEDLQRIRKSAELK
jgi:prevent-host-death family protein